MMQSSLTSGRILCIDCRVCVDTIRRFVVFDLNTRVISLLSEWLSPLIITEEDYICETCYEIAMREVNRRMVTLSGDGQIASSSRQERHTQVCAQCSCPLIRRQSHPICINNPSPMERMIRTIIETRINPHQIMTSDRICHSCWVSIRRSAVRQQQIDEARAQEDEHQVEPVNVEEEIIVDQNIADEERGTGAVTGHLTMLNYRRAANTASHCLYYV